MRTMLYVPANNAGNVLNSPYMGADGIILECEDAVSPAEKDAARIMARNAIRTLPYECEVLVRINDLNTEYWEDDLLTVVTAGLDHIILPKAESEQYVKQCDDVITKLEKEAGLPVGGIGLMPIIESAIGIERAYKIVTASQRISGVLLGAGDLANDMGSTRTPGGNEIAYARGRLLTAAHAAKIEAYDTPYMYAQDIEGAKEDARKSKQWGFTGMAVVFPSLVDIVNSSFSPTQKEIERAEGIVDALKEAERNGRGVVTYKGEMIDIPIVRRAMKTLQLAEKLRLR